MIDERYYCDRCGGVIEANGDGSGFRYRVTVEAVQIRDHGYPTFTNTSTPTTKDLCVGCLAALELDRLRPPMGHYGWPRPDAYEYAPRPIATPETHP